ncbi:HlyD family secretion protein [Reyranella sp.]|uniref:HlyD family secretion protein n=1 Tax=Reyranella sp. TaxID=1929291 RepID=UPI003BA99808
MADRSSFRRSADEVTTPAPVANDADQVAAETLLKRFDVAGKPAEKTGSARKPRNLRRILLVLGPAIVLAGSLFAYMTGGRYVSTDNAYVHAGKLTVATDVSGIVANVAVHESQRVEKGQVLFTLDQEPFRIALAGAEANLGTVRNQIVTQQATYRQKLAQIEQARTDIGFFETNAQRQQDLLKRGVSAQATYDQAKRDLDTARERLLVAQSDAEATLAQLGGRADAPIEQNANYLAAKAQVDRARRDLNHTTVVAPMPGIVTNVDALLPGEYLPAAQPAFSLVSTADVWVEANAKESDLANLKPGDKATVSIDAYPGREWQATVTSLAPATGAEFSVLPAQNATGNWVKVVQRVPIRLGVEMPEGAPPLRTGMSAYVEIDTGHHRQLSDLFSGF